jgi:hypothetical protein
MVASFFVRDGAPKSFRINPSEQGQSQKIIIDNGEFKVEVDKASFERVCESKKMTAAQRESAWQAISQFAELVEREKGPNDHPGSTDPYGAIHSAIYVGLAEAELISLEEVKGFVTEIE